MSVPDRPSIKFAVGESLSSFLGRPLASRNAEKPDQLHLRRVRRLYKSNVGDHVNFEVRNSSPGPTRFQGDTVIL
jgi:hypothetical protein